MVNVVAFIGEKLGLLMATKRLYGDVQIVLKMEKNIVEIQLRLRKKN